MGLKRSLSQLWIAQKNANLAWYKKFLNEDCSIPFSWYVDTSAKALKYRDLNVS